jgi:hypothetical protein
MTVEERVTRFLRDYRQPFCDACIARALRLGAGKNRSMARNATAALATIPDFRRGPRTCSECHQARLVTLSVGVN